MKRQGSWLEQLLVMTVLVVVVTLFQAVFAGSARAGTTVYDLGISTPGNVGVLLSTGPGNVKVEISSGMPGDFFVVWDSSQPTLANASESGSLSTQNHKRIATVLVTVTSTTYRMDQALPFARGAVVLKNADGRRASAVVNQ